MIIQLPFWLKFLCASLARQKIAPAFQLGTPLGLGMASTGSSPSDQVSAKAAFKPKAKPPPAALRQQVFNASSRWDDASSTSSWVRAEEEQSADRSNLPSVPEVGQSGQTPLNVVPPPPPPGGQPVQQGAQQAAQPAATTAPVLQAAQGLLNHSNENPTARRLRFQQERAARRGRCGVRWGQLAPGNLAHNPLNTALPDHLSQLGAGEGERSILVLDDRDRRVQSPFQGWLLDEVLTNALAGINVRADRHSVRAPSTGYHFSLFMVRTLDAVKVIMVGTMTSYGQAPCARWDAHTGSVMSHSAFQPFRWPPMTEQSPTWIDVKVKLEGHLLVHMEFRGYRSDRDLSLQLWHVADAIQQILQETVFVPSFIVTVFQGWRVVACSWEIGGRIYVCSEGGVVVALDYPLCHMELRFVATSSPDAFGADADRLEMRFLSAGDRLDVSASIVQAPPSMLVVSRVSGPTLIRKTPNGAVSMGQELNALISSYSSASWQLFMHTGRPRSRRPWKATLDLAFRRWMSSRTPRTCTWSVRVHFSGRRGRSSGRRHWRCSATILWMKS